MHRLGCGRSICLFIFSALIISALAAIVPLPAQVNEQSATLPKDTTVVDMTRQDLLQFYSAELRNLKFSLDKNETDALLAKIGDKVRSFFHDFSNTSSKENVVLQILNYNGGIETSKIEEFRYLILYHPNEDRPLLEEYRTDTKNRPIDSSAIAGFFMTSGYACFSLNFHPVYRETSTFRYLGQEEAKAGAHIIAFAQKPEMNGLPVVYAESNTGKELRLPVQGLAWIEPETYQILRLRIDLIPSENESSIREQTTDVQFGEVQLGDAWRKLWLPREAVVTTKLAIPQRTAIVTRPVMRSFRNVHRYSDYRLFQVASDYKIAPPESR